MSGHVIEDISIKFVTSRLCKESKTSLLNQFDRWETSSLPLPHRLQADKPVAGPDDCS